MRRASARLARSGGKCNIEKFERRGKFASASFVPNSQVRILQALRCIREHFKKGDRGRGAQCLNTETKHPIAPGQLRCTSVAEVAQAKDENKVSFSYVLPVMLESCKILEGIVTSCRARGNERGWFGHFALSPCPLLDRLSSERKERKEAFCRCALNIFRFEQVQSVASKGDHAEGTLHYPPIALAYLILAGSEQTSAYICSTLLKANLVLQAAAVFVAVLALLGSAAAQNDVDILNFALNLECLEAAFYTCAAFGVNLTDAYLGEPLRSLLQM